MTFCINFPKAPILSSLYRCLLHQSRICMQEHVRAIHQSTIYTKEYAGATNNQGFIHKSTEMLHQLMIYRKEHASATPINDLYARVGTVQAMPFFTSKYIILS